MEENGEGSTLPDLSQLEKEIDQVSQEKQETERGIRQLRSREDVEAGLVYPGRIHELQQEKLRLEVELLKLTNRKNRLLWEQGPS